MKHQHPYQPIENYGIIGGSKTVALVSLTGSDFYVVPARFDSPTIFAAMPVRQHRRLLSVEPQMKKTKKSKQLYIPGTAVLLTRFFRTEGIAEIIDYMPINKAAENSVESCIVRKIKPSG